MKSASATFLIFFAVKSFAADVGLARIAGGGDPDTAPSPTSLIGLYLADSSGRRAGVDPTRPPVIDPQYLSHSCCYIGEIPGIDGAHNRLDPDDDSGSFGNEDFEIKGQLPADTYNLVVFSTVAYAVPYLIDLRFYDAAGKMNENTTRSFLPAGTTASFTINYDPAPGRVPIVTKTVNFPILRQELQAAFQLGQIGGKRFVEELDDILAQGEKALARKDRDPDNLHGDGDAAHGKREAVAKLCEFITRVNQAARARPGDHGHDQGRDDDGRRFATATAAQSLTSDAKTLIAQLGGKPQDDDRGGDGRDGERH